MQQRAEDDREVAAMSALRAAGVPTNSDELRGFCEVPADVPDVTEPWIDIFARHRKISNQIFNETGIETTEGLPILWEEDRGRSIPPPGNDWDREQQCAVYLDRFREVIRDARSQSMLPGGIRGLTIAHLDDNEPHPTFDGYSSLGRLLILDCHFQARVGRWEEALIDLHAALALVNTGRFEPEFNGAMILERVHSLAAIAAVRLAAKGVWSNQQLSELQEAIAKPDFRRRLQRAHRGTVGSNFTMVDAGDSMVAKTFFQESQSIYAEQMLLVIDGFNNEWPDVFESQQAFMVYLDELDTQPKSKRRSLPFILLSPATVSICQETAEAVAIQRAAVIALACQRQKQTTDCLPTQLDEITPELLPPNFSSVDPFTGVPMKLVLTSAGPVVYSCGRNHQDEGGRIFKDEEFERAADTGVLSGWTEQSSAQ